MALSTLKRIEKAVTDKWRGADEARRAGDARLELVHWHKADGAMYVAERLGYICHCMRDKTDTTSCHCKRIREMVGKGS